jgi:hypothetical protein
VVEEAARASLSAAGLGGPVETEEELRSVALQRAMAFEEAGTRTV